jgi:hypothetical protein
VISFPYFNLENGPHTIELKVWDIHNNSNKASINFVVASSGTMALNALFNYPNPVSDYTTFSFEHNQSGEDLDVIIEIYSIDGKRVTSIEKRFTANSYRNNEIEWDATDESGAKISKGVYIYKVNLQIKVVRKLHKQADWLLLNKTTMKKLYSFLIQSLLYFLFCLTLPHLDKTQFWKMENGIK